jgi:hypothetical protein
MFVYLAVTYQRTISFGSIIPASSHYVTIYTILPAFLLLSHRKAYSPFARRSKLTRALIPHNMTSPTISHHR